MNMNCFAAGIDWAEKGSTAGVVVLQGMLTIFLVLAIIWFCIEIMHLVVHGKDKTPKAPKESKAPKSVTANSDDAAIAAAIAASLAASEDDGAIVAAITAAITAARAASGDTGSFRVVSFKRADSAKARRRF